MIGIVTNPRARGLIRDRHLTQRLREVVGPWGSVRETRSPAELEGALQEFRSLGIDVLSTCGGDGTNLSVLSEAARCFPPGELPKLLFLRGGTVNTAANELGIHGHPEEILGRFMRRYRQRLPLPTVERELLGVQSRRGFLFGAGMASRFFEAYYGGPWGGVVWAGVLAARIIGSAFVGGGFARWVFDPIEAEVVADGVRLPHDRFSLIIAGTIANAGLGFKPTYRAPLHPGRFQLIASGLMPAQLAGNAARCVRGTRLEGQPHFDLVCREARIALARPQTYTFDGDLFRGTEVTITAGPRIAVVTA
jgi:diacylglycerol kinase family enzyme